MAKRMKEEEGKTEVVEDASSTKRVEQEGGGEGEVERKMGKEKGGGMHP